MKKLLLLFLIISTGYLYTMEGECLLCNLVNHEAPAQRFPVIEKTEHWTVVINMLSQLRGSILLIPNRCVKSFTELTLEELESYRELIIKYQDLLHQDTDLDAFNTGWQEKETHLVVETGVRCGNDAGAVTMLLGNFITTRNPRIFYENMCELQSIPEEEIRERLSGDSSILASQEYFETLDTTARKIHHFDSSDRETHKNVYAPAHKKKSVGCPFCRILERGIDAEGSSLVYVADHACACTSIGSYTDPHLLYFPTDHKRSFASLSREEAIAFLEMSKKCLWVLQHNYDKLGTYLPAPVADSFIQEGSGSGATVPLHLHGQVVLETEPPEGIVSTYYNPKKPKRDLGRIRMILKKGFEEEFSHR